MSNMLPDWNDPSQVQDFLNSQFNDPTLMPAQFTDWMINRTEQSIQIPIDNVIGYQQFSASAVTAVITEESSSSLTASFGQLATRGPYVTGLSDGRYRFDWGASCSTNATAARARMGISIDGAQPDLTIPLATGDTTNPSGTSGSFVFTLSGLRGGAGGHTVECLYNTNGAATGTWGQRYMTVHQVSS